jgi:type IV pilus assembly protein PilF
MSRRFWQIYTVLLALVLTAGTQSYAQKLNTKLSKRDVRNIKAQAELTIAGLGRLMNTVSDPSLTASDLDEAIGNAFTGEGRIFYQNDFEVDDDTDPENTKADETLLGISSYLRQFRNFYKQNKSGSIRLQVTDIPDVRIGQSNLYIKVYYTQYLNGKSRAGKAFPKSLKVAEMQVIPVRGQYQTLINAMNFADKKEAPGFKTVTVTDAGDDDAGAAESVSYSEFYYRQKLQLGVKYLGESNFTEAYYALNEAKRSKDQSAEAEQKLNEVYSRLRSLNLDPIEYLFNGLSSKGQVMVDKYQYDIARKYYTYAKEVKPAGAKQVSSSLLAIAETQGKERLLWNLFNQGSYSEAIKGFRRGADKQPDNPEMYIGMARCYEQLGQEAQAEASFASAQKADPSFADTYKWLGYFEKHRKSYGAAYDAFVNYQSRAEDQAEPVINSEIAFCKGMQLYQRQDYAKAQENFRSALGIAPGNKDAQLALARVSMDTKELKQARKLVSEVLAGDNSNAEAYYLLARIQEAENNKNGAAESYNLAIANAPKTYSYYYELGKIQMEPEVAKYEAAIQNFSFCINAPVKSLNNKLAYWKRGKCYYMVGGKDDEAAADFRKADELMPTKPAAFYVDYGSLLIRQKKYAMAGDYFKKAPSDPGASFGLGIISYQLAPQDETTFLNYFERAFRDGVATDVVKNEPSVPTLYANNKRFKSLMKKYKYSSLY